MPSPNNDDQRTASPTDFLRTWLEARFYNFKVEGEPQQGTYGQVWVMRANDSNIFPERFALKTLDPTKLAHSLDDQMLRNFERELRLWLTLRPHLNILSALGIELAPAPRELQERTRAVPLVRMPFCETTLETWIAQPLTAIGRADRLFGLAQLCNGLAWSYRHGLQGHGDLKPSNVLISSLASKLVLPETGPFPSRAHPWLIRLADFGWADAWVDLGFSDKAWRPYLAPERYAGEVKPVASDMFAVGIIGAEIFQGVHPAGEATPKVGKWKKDKIQKWAAEGARELSKVEPPEMREALLTCMAPDPDKRLGPAELIEAIHGVLWREFGFEIQPLLELWNRDAVGEFDGRSAGTGATLRAAWAAEETATIDGSSLDTALQNLEGRLKAIDQPTTLLQCGDWLVVANSLASLLRRRGEPGDIVRLQKLAGATRDLTRRLLIPCTSEDWRIAWDKGLKNLTISPKDFEGFTDFVRTAIGLLETVDEADQVRQLFENSPPFARAAYHYCLASRLHGLGRNKSAVAELEKCIELLPSDPHLQYMRTNWTLPWELFPEFAK